VIGIQYAITSMVFLLIGFTLPDARDRAGGFRRRVQPVAGVAAAVAPAPLNATKQR
jgi:NhaP-type Na+/H+ or K+/H+ antiporter